MADKDGKILGGQELSAPRTLDVTLRREVIGLLDERREVMRRLQESNEDLRHSLRLPERLALSRRYADLCENIAIQVELARRGAVERAEAA